MSIKNLRKIASKGICERGNGCPDTVAVMASRRRNIMEMFQYRNIMAIIWPPNSHRRKYYVHHGTPGNFQYCRLSWGCKTNIFSLSAKTFISSPQMFTPAMGFYSQTCKRAKDLAFHSKPGTLEMNLFLYLFTFCSRKRALLCTNTSAWAFRDGLSLIFGESTGSMLFNSTIQSQIENIVRKNF